MPESSELVRLPEGVALHARPAGEFVRTAATFVAAIEIKANGRRANGKSILEILGLGADGGAELRITASGDDATRAVTELAGLIQRLA